MRDEPRYWYGQVKIDGNGNRYKLKEVVLQFSTESQSAYHNSVEYYDNFEGVVKVQTETKEQATFLPFPNINLYSKTSHDDNIHICRLPKHLQEKMKELWREIEKELANSGQK